VERPFSVHLPVTRPLLCTIVSWQLSHVQLSPNRIINAFLQLATCHIIYTYHIIKVVHL
jgi:hypothetical protein